MTNETRPETTPEHMPRGSYLEQIYEELGHLRIWDYLQYDHDGNLCIVGDDNEGNTIATRFIDLVQKEDTSLEIVDPSIVKRRAGEWIQLAEAVREETGYEGDLGYYYAMKASQASEIVTAAVKGGWNLETSSEGDLLAIEWLVTKGIVDKNIPIVCNGYKAPPEKLFSKAQRVKPQEGIVFHEVGDGRRKEDLRSYAEEIVRLVREGYNITPIVDSLDELVYFAQSGMPNMNIGLRFKSYKAPKNDNDFDTLVSRHGLSIEQMFQAADFIKDTRHLTLTTFHAMMGAAETIPVETLVDSLLSASNYFFELKRNHPELDTFNMGGGMTPLGYDYDHRRFLHQLFTQLTHLSEYYDLPVPKVDFEFGSYIADEAAFGAMRLVSEKWNHREAEGPNLPWAIGDFSFMRGILDQVLIDKRYIILAANYAQNKPKLAYVGDFTCDSDGFFRTDREKQDTVLMPQVDINDMAARGKPLVLVIVGIQAYEEALTGVDGNNHCALLEPDDMILVRKDGDAHVYIQRNKTYREASAAFGYRDDMVPVLENI